MSCGQTLRWDAMWKWPGIAVGVQVLCRPAVCLCARTSGWAVGLDTANIWTFEYELFGAGTSSRWYFRFQSIPQKTHCFLLQTWTTYTAFNPAITPLTTNSHLSLYKVPATYFGLCFAIIVKWQMMLIVFNCCIIVSILHRTWNTFSQLVSCLLW